MNGKHNNYFDCHLLVTRICRHFFRIKEQGPRFVSAVVDLIDNIDNLEALRSSIRQLVSKPNHTKHELMADDYMVPTLISILNFKFYSFFLFSCGLDHSPIICCKYENLFE